MARIRYDFQSLGPVEGGTAQQTSGTSAQDSGVASGGAATIEAGDVVVYANGYWAKVADGGAATAGQYGLAVEASDETASADGLVTVLYHPAGLLVRGTPTTVGNLALAIIGDRVTMDVASGNQTVDENDAGNGELRILRYVSTSGQESIDVVLPWNASLS